MRLLLRFSTCRPWPRPLENTSDHACAPARVSRLLARDRLPRMGLVLSLIASASLAPPTSLTLLSNKLSA